MPDCWSGPIRKYKKSGMTCKTQRTHESSTLLQGNEDIWRARREQIPDRLCWGDTQELRGMASLQQPHREGPRGPMPPYPLPLSDSLLGLPFDWLLGKPEAKARHSRGSNRGSPAEETKGLRATGSWASASCCFRRRRRWHWTKEELEAHIPIKTSTKCCRPESWFNSPAGKYSTSWKGFVITLFINLVCQRDRALLG